MKMSMNDEPRPRVYVERIGDREIELAEAKLDVFADVVLWQGNPRLQAIIAASEVPSEEELEAALRRISPNGYQTLKRSIQDLGQMEPIYAWRRDDDSKFLVVEGATRVTILRELARAGAEKHKTVRAKILPSSFGREERAILLARIHVRGSGVRSWGRYIEAKFIHDNVTDYDGRRALFSVSDLARYMEKSPSWVQRLRDAYEFAKHFVDHVDLPEGEGMVLAAKEFSTLEEISKASSIGPKLREYSNPEHDTLRSEVYEMVQNDVFREYRDARFMKEFHEDPQKWAALKTGEKGIASKLAAEIKTGSSSLKARIGGLEQQLDRALERDPTAADDEDLDSLRRATRILEGRLHPGVSPFRSQFAIFTRIVGEASLFDVKSVQQQEITSFQEVFTDFLARHQKVNQRVQV